MSGNWPKIETTDGAWLDDAGFRTNYPCIVVTPYTEFGMFHRPDVAQRLQHRREARRRQFCKRYHTKLQWGLS